MTTTTSEKPFQKSPFKVPPQDLSAEQALLGAILLNPNALAEIIDTISVNSFYSLKHRTVYKAILHLYEKSEPIDVISLTSYLKDKKSLDQIGGGSYLAELTNTVPTTANIKYYAELVSKKSSLRRLIESADTILNLGYNEDDEVDSILDKAEKIIFGLTNLSKKTFINIKDILSEAWDRFDHLHKNKDGIRGVSTGFKDLDNLLAGLQNSDLIILAARPSMGKTTLALDIVRHVACRNNIATAVFSLEMSSHQVVDRIIAAEARVNSWKLRTGKISTDQDFARIRDALDSLSKAPIFIDDEPSNTIIKMKAVARRLKSEHNLGLIVVDYLQLMVPQRATDSMVQQVTEISRSLKALARELDVPVVALSQLSRAVEQRGGKPRLSDLRDSGSIEQDADVVMFIHRDDKYNEESDKKNIAEILVEKHRNGPTGKVELYFDQEKISFVPIEKGNFGSF